MQNRVEIRGFYTQQSPLPQRVAPGQAQEWANHEDGPGLVSPLRNRSRWAAARLIALACAIIASPSVHAEDSERCRPYLRFASGDIEPIWGVDDHWSLGLGVNLDRYLGTELAFDYYLKNWGKPEIIGEASSFHMVPELRLRYPLFKDRLVPYLIVGAGPSWIQGKDNRPSTFGRPVSLEGWTVAVAAGGGLDYFIADNVALNLEGKYLWVNPINGTIDGQTQSVDLSAPLFTFGLRVYFTENRPRPLLSRKQEPESRLYFGVRAGADFLTDDRWVPGVRLRPEQAAWGGVASQTGGLLLGADIGRHFGVEIAADHVNHRIDVDGLGTVAEYGQGWVLANLRLRFPLERWEPYVYAGGGLVYGEFKDYQPPSEGLTLEGDTFHPALNVGAGLEYFITHNFSLNADVRWAYTWNQGFGIENYLPKANGDYSIFAATIGFRVYLFGL